MHKLCCAGMTIIIKFCVVFAFGNASLRETFEFLSKEFSKKNYANLKELPLECETFMVLWDFSNPAPPGDVICY